MQNLQPLFLCLCPCDLISLSIFDIFSPIGIGWNGVGLKLHNQRKQFVIIEDFFIIVFEIFVPDATNLSVALQSLLFLWLFSLSTDKLCHKLWFDFIYGSLEIIRRLFLLTYREKSLFEWVESDFQHDIGISDPVIGYISVFLHFPTRLNFLSPCERPDTYPPGVIKQISVLSENLTR